MVSTNDAPVFMKIEGFILMTAAVLTLVYTYLDSVRLSSDALDLGLDSFSILVLRTLVGVITIICVYGLLKHSRACWVITIAGFVLMIRFNIANFDMVYNLVPLIVNVLALISLIRPSVIRYVFRMKKEQDKISADDTVA